MSEPEMLGPNICFFLDLYTNCAYIQAMGFEWDEKKATTNIKKHGIDFADAVTIFDDSYAITVIDPDHAA